MNMRIVLIIFSLSALQQVKCANILAMFPLPFYSHTNAFLPVFKELVARGHNLTMVSPFPQEKSQQNWTDIVINNKPYDEYIGKNLDFFYSLNPYLYYPMITKFALELLEIAFKDETLQHLINDDSLNFDLIIAEPLFYQEALVTFSHKFNAPFVATYPMKFSAWPSYMSGNGLPPSYVPNCRGPYSDEMTFFERVSNTILNIIELLNGIFYNMPSQEHLIEKHMVYLGSVNRPPLKELLKNISLHLIDTHYSVGYIEPYQPNTIPVGGLSLKVSEKLPDDLQKYMDDSPNGIVYLSFGGGIRVASLEEQILNSIVNAFRSLKLNVLMKWENDTFPNKPTNIESRKWFPQTDILAHPNCRLFITHGGLHSITEALYFGIPVVGIPFFADQIFNMRFAQRAGFGQAILPKDITSKTFQDAIEEVLSDNSYKESAVKRSLIIKDRPQSALETAVYWIEYALRHRNLSHLRAASVELSLYQFHNYDVILFLLIIFLTPVITVLILSKVFIKSYKQKRKTE